MRGLMMDTPLTIVSIARHVEQFHGEREIVSVTADDPKHRTTWRTTMARARQLANALSALKLKRGDRVATLAWNDHRHLEIYYAVSCSGLICHTINPRLFAEQIVYIVNHARDQFLFVDPMFVPLLEAIEDKLQGVRGIVLLTQPSHLPETRLSNVYCYEALLDAEDDEFEWPALDERDASALCYTSGTTGNPKGVLYNHRSTVLHAYASVAPDAVGLSSRDSVLPVVPLFHVNAWGIPYSTAIAGAKLVLPGPRMGDGEALFRMIESEAVTLALGVPTVWLALLGYAEQSGQKLTQLQRTVIGGAAVPRSMIEAFRDVHDVEVRQGWGMTEMSPLGTVNTLKAGLEHLGSEARLDLATKAGRGVYGCELRIVDDQGTELPWDGERAGALQVRGPWICSGYFGETPDAALTTDDWFDTGDVATIDSDGYLQITDRSKDVIKSGGEWISSIALENVAMSYSDIAEAAVIGVPHPKWTERPLLVVVARDNTEVDAAELLQHFEGKVADWWVPSAVEFVDELPHTATGKVKKIELRRQFADYRLPG